MKHRTLGEQLEDHQHDRDMDKRVARIVQEETKELEAQIATLEAELNQWRQQWIDGMPPREREAYLLWQKKYNG